jgi:sirohydrochlorin cobaltochelatase
MGYGWSAACYTGITTPLLPEALDRCRRLGFGRIVVFPFLVFTGVLEKSTRKLVDAFNAAQRDVEVVYASYLNAHPLLCDVFRERAL